MYRSSIDTSVLGFATSAGSAFEMSISADSRDVYADPVFFGVFSATNRFLDVVLTSTYTV